MKILVTRTFFFLLMSLYSCATIKYADQDRYQHRSKNNTQIISTDPFYMLPTKRPDNFGFRIQFIHYYAGDILDTFKGKIKKDLVDGDTTAQFILSDEQLDTIYAKMLNMDLFNYNNLRTMEDFKQAGCFKTYDFYICADTVKKYIRSISCNGINKEKVNLLDQLIEYIKNIVVSSEEYKKLPEPRAIRR